MSTLQKQILESIDIPQFSSDLRLVILDFLYVREITPLICRDISYYLRIGPTLIDDQIFYQISVYNDTFYRDVSSFGLYCEEKAMQQYNSLKKIIHSDMTQNDLNTVMFADKGEDTNIYFLFAFCPYDESTVMIHVTKARPSYCALRIYVTTKEDVKRTLITNCLRANQYWKSVVSHVTFGLEEDLRKLIFSYQEEALIHGKNWPKYIDRGMRYVPEDTLYDVLWSKFPLYHVTEKS